MNSIRQFQGPLGIVLTALMILVSTACFQRYRIENSRLPKIQNIKGLEFVLLDEGAPTSNIWHLSNTNFEQDTFSARIVRGSEAFGLKIASIRGNADFKKNQNLVLIYLKPLVAMSLGDSLSAHLSYRDIDRVEVFEHNSGERVAGSFLTISGCVLGTVLALLVVCNCPHVYAETPGGPVELEGSLYGGAIYPQLERTDYLPMKHLQATDGQYKIRLVNQESQHQFSNLIALEMLDHAPGMMPVFDQYGQVHTIGAPQAPLAASDVSGKDVLPDLMAEDGQVCLGDLGNQSDDAVEKLTLRFAKPAWARQAKLLLNAKNSRWLDYTYFEFKRALGEYADEVDRKYRRLPAARSLEWAEKQKMYLGVWLETTPGYWEKSDHFQLPGGSTFRNLVLPLDLSKVAGDEIRIRLEFGFHFWEIDRAALDFSEDQPVQQTTLRPLIATDDTGKDVTAALLEDDDRYYEQPEIGDEASVRFDAPPLADGLERSLVLRASGHYKVLYQNAPGKPGLFKLKSWEKENALPRLSRQRWLELSSFVTH